MHVRDFAEVVRSVAASEATGSFEIDDMSGGHNWTELAAINGQISGLPKRVTYLPQVLVTAIAVVAEAVSFITRKPGMITRAKVCELYHDDWVVQGQNWPRPKPIGLAEGLYETLEWYRSHGWLTPIAKSQENKNG